MSKTEQKWRKPREAECVGQCPNCGDFKYRDLETGEIFCSCEEVA